MAARGYALDMKADGFGLIQLGFHAVALHADPLTDNLYMVLDAVDEPTSVYLPEPGDEPTPSDTTIYQFDGGESLMTYRWRGKLFLLPRPSAPQMCQVQAEDYDNLLFRLYGDGDLYFERVITSAEEFTLPQDDEYKTIEIEFIGTSRVRRVQVAEDVMELD